MKPTPTAAEFIRQGRQAGHDALGIAHDPEALLAVASLRRSVFLSERSAPSLRSWRELVGEIAATAGSDPGLERWLGAEHLRLDRAFREAGSDDPTLPVALARWCAGLSAGDQLEVLGRFELDLLAPLTVEAAGSRG